MALSIDGTVVTGSGHNGSSVVSGALTTLLTNDILVAIVANSRTNSQGSSTTVSGITDNKSINTWARRGAALSFHSAAAGTPFVTVEIWWQLASAAQSGIVATANFSAGIDDSAIVLFGVNGANISAPWDTNAALPASATASGSGSSIPTVTGAATDYDKTMLLGAVYAAASSNSFSTDQTAGTGFTILANIASSAGTNFSKAAGQRQIVSAVQSGLSVPYGVSWPGWAMLVDAIIASDAVKQSTVPVKMHHYMTQRTA